MIAVLIAIVATAVLWGLAKVAVKGQPTYEEIQEMIRQTRGKV